MILSIVSYESRKIILYEKNFELTKNNTFNNISFNRIFPQYRLLPVVKKKLDFHKLLFFVSFQIFSIKNFFFSFVTHD